jgi:hypothetical protein
MSTSKYDDFAAAIQLDAALESSVDSVLFRLKALKNYKILYFKFNPEDDWIRWQPSYTNLSAVLEGIDDHPSIIRMDVLWHIEG